MHQFRVWAPFPQKVELQLGNRKYRMRRGAGDVWSVNVPGAQAGMDYGFLLDGMGPLPDPRSPWQPAGVHGLSRIVDHGAFKWTDRDWQPPDWNSAVVYELHIGTFTPEGTFVAAMEKLDHLVRVGVTHVELMPVNEFSGDHGWGYDGVDLFAPHHGYGTPDDLKRLVDACHKRNLAVIADVVYNHLGPTGNYLAKYGPYFTSRYRTPWGDALNFDAAYNDPVRRFFCDNALMWLKEYHFDGLRLDAVHAIFDTSAEPFLEQLGREVKVLEAELGRRLIVIAESDLNDPRLLWPHERGGFALDAQWADDFHHSLHAILTGERNGYYADFGSLADLAKAFRKAFVYDGRYSEFRKRRHGRPADGLPSDRFVVCLQNHDQVGNRAIGERSTHLMNEGHLKIGAALMLLSPFVPMLFQGEEWGASTRFLYFTDHRDPELARNVREGRQNEFADFGWKPEEVPDPQAAETFRRSKLNWKELNQREHAGLLAWHRKLTEIRRSLNCGSGAPLDDVHVEFDERTRWFMFRRSSIEVACNLGARKQRIPLSGQRSRAILLASGPDVSLKSGSVVLPANSVAVLLLG